MDFTFDLATNQLIPTNGVDEITLKWRSREPVRIHFHRDGTDELLPSGFGLALYLKRSTTMLATCTSFTAPGTAAGYYTGTLILNTDPLTTAFTTATVLSIAAKVEAHWWASGESASPSISDSVVSAQIVRPVVAPEPSSVETVTLGYEGTDIKSTGETGGAKYLREDGDGTCSWQSPSGSGDALVANNLDQFASVTQTAGQTLAITASTTLAGGTHSGTNTGDQSLAAYLTSATASSTYQPLDADLTSIAGLTKAGNTLKVIRVNAGETAYELATVTSGSGDALVANPLSQFAATTSAQLAGVISDETGSGALVFANSPTLTTPTIGDGTEAAPSLSFTSDTNTGVYRPAADTVGIVGGGNDVVRMTGIASATDYLEIKNGIGVGSPLHVLAEGASENIGVHLQPKGSGLLTISDGIDFNKGIRFRSSSSAASAVTLIDAVSTAGRVITLPDATGTLALVSGDIGTPSALVGTNITGTAASLTAGLVTSIGNLTGDVTSSNRETTLATVNSNVGAFGSATQAPAVTVNAKGLVTAISASTITPAVGSITGLGTGVATALAVNVGSAGAPVVNGGALGTPSSGNLASCTFPTLNQNTSGYAEALKSATTTVSVSASAAPTSGQVLTATSSTAATWQTPSGGGGGKVAQVVVATNSTPASTTSNIPIDNTIPQNTEGAEFLTATITPTNASSTLLVSFNGWGGTGVIGNFSLALFRDSVANAIQVTTITNSVANYTFSTGLFATATASSTSATTFKIRFGPNNANTAYMMRSSALASFFGGVDSATLTITEILP